MTLQKIISYVDLGNRSQKGVQLTAAIAENHGASVEVVLTAAKMPLSGTSFGGEAAFVPPGHALRLLTKEQEAVRLSDAVEVLDSNKLDGLVATHRLGTRQVDALIEHARESAADLIVMSCERAGIFDRLFHRSFVEKLARSSSCPVVVIAGETEVTPPLRHILVATDYSEHSRRGALVARDMVGEKGKLTFQHVLPKRPEIATKSANGPTSPASDTEHARLETWVGDLHFEDVETTCCVTAGAADEEIARIANEIDADIIVVGSRPHEDWREKLFGTVTDRLIENCGRPVLAVPLRAVVPQPMSKLDNTLSQSFPASDPASSWAGPAD